MLVLERFVWHRPKGLTIVNISSRGSSADLKAKAHLKPYHIWALAFTRHSLGSIFRKHVEVSAIFFVWHVPAAYGLMCWASVKRMEPYRHMQRNLDNRLDHETPSCVLSL